MQYTQSTDVTSTLHQRKRRSTLLKQVANNTKPFFILDDKGTGVFHQSSYNWRGCPNVFSRSLCRS